MNLCVNSRGGTFYLSSMKESQTGTSVFEYVDKCIEDVGPEKVVQVITDGADNNLAAAAKMLKEKRPGIFWSSCAAHTVNLMLEDIFKLPKISKYIDKAKALTLFVYAHEKTFAVMRHDTKEKDVVRAGVTRFATTFLPLQSLLEKKQQLMSIFVSYKWDRCKDSIYMNGRFCYYTCLSPAFWNGVSRVVNVLEPLVKVLKMVEGEKKPSMGFIYGELLEAKRCIKAATNNLEKYYHPIFEIIDEKIRGRLDSPLHLAAYLLNPFYLYNKPDVVKLDETLMNGFLTCVETFYHEHWWSMYGCTVRNLAILARKILSLTSCSSGCQRNWSTFKQIHKSERNRLDADRMDSLVYVQFNSNLLNKRKRIKEVGEYDMLVGDDGENVEEWFVEVGQGEEDEHIDEDDEDSAFHIEFESEDELM
ncbi:uncharacterized protein LOC108841336 isoform X2 [Raphanus sativus]|uniref:Uncharacterized protein LOC108841336 isoform X2 n=1 Tax=Raphanus sativus TaxID=3726 RepID=A0A6J0MC20_RAPSA|nr:uncharacterized protein LOC108841336 isoform X2 [Raphanus sativus]